MSALIGTLSDAFALRDPHKRAYFLIGAIAFLGLLVGYAIGFKVHAALPPRASFTYSVVTGLVLLGCILYQWMLFFARLTRQVEKSRLHYKLHRWVGTAAVVIFALHAGAFGYALVTVLAVAFAVIAVTGLFNKEVLLLRRPWLRTAWEVGHVGLSGIVLPLIALHVWAVLAFK